MTNILDNNTNSLCNVCYKEVPAKVHERDGRVYIIKKCPIHGEFEGLLEKDADFYKWYKGLSPQTFPVFNSLYIPITYKCNMNCKYCYAWFPKRKDPTFNEIMNAVRNFSGNEIDISGGEPTLREDLEEIISCISKLGKRTMIITNGLKLADYKYLVSLKKAGLDMIAISLDSLNEEFYNTIKRSGSNKALQLKKQALKNIEKCRIPTFLGSTIYPGVNDGEIKDLFMFALKRNNFIVQFRLSSCSKIGRNKQTNLQGYYQSELYDLFFKQLKIDKKDIMKYYYAQIGKNFVLCLNGKIRGQEFIPFYENNSDNSAKTIENSFLHKTKQSLFRKSINFIFNPLGIYPFPMKMFIKILSVSNVENIDIKGIGSSLAYLYNGKEVLPFTQGIILEEKTEEARFELARAKPLTV